MFIAVWYHMLLHDQQVRLSHRERDILLRLTGSDPCHITTRQQLREWVDHYLRALPEDGLEVKMIKDVLRRHLPV